MQPASLGRAAGEAKHEAAAHGSPRLRVGVLHLLSVVHQASESGLAAVHGGHAHGCRCHGLRHDHVQCLLTKKLAASVRSIVVYSNRCCFSCVASTVRTIRYVLGSVEQSYAASCNPEIRRFQSRSGNRSWNGFVTLVQMTVERLHDSQMHNVHY